MGPSPAAAQHQHGWQRCLRHQSTRSALAWLGDPHRTCRPLSALPNGNSPVGPTQSVGVVDRATTAAPASSSSPASSVSPHTSAPLPDRSVGYLSLSLVPLLWGTYSPCIRYLYAEADPLDPASLTAVRTVLSAGALLLPALIGYLVKRGGEIWRRNQGHAGSSSTEGTEAEPTAGTHRPPLGAATLAASADGAADGVAAAAAAEEMLQGARPEQPSARGSLFAEPLNRTRLGPVLTRTFDSVVLGGLELGILNFLGTALQVEGLHSTSATRAGFLAEVTAVLTPLVSYLAGYTIPRQMWLAVSVGLVGSTMVAYDTSLTHDAQAAPSAGAPNADPRGPTPMTELAGVSGCAGSLGSPARQSGLLAPDATDATCSIATELLRPDPSAPAESLSLSLPMTANSAASSSPSATDGAMSLPGAIGDAMDAVSANSSAGAIAGAGAAGAGATLGVAPLSTSVEPAYAAAVSTTTAAFTMSSHADDAMTSITSTVTLAATDMTNSAVTIGADVATSVADAAPSVISMISAAVDSAATSLPVAAVSSAIEAVGPSTADATAAVAATAVSAAAAEAAAIAGSATTPLAITGGEAYLLLACLFYSICTVRMGIYAPRMDTVGLAAMKKVGLSSMSVLWMAATNLQNGVAPGAVLAFPDLSSRTPTSIAVLMYSGLGPGALATFLQVTGLSTVPATTAQVIYSMTPLCTAFFAYLILGGETTGPVAWAGGSLIILAALLAADAQQKQHREQMQQQQQQVQQQQQQQQF